MSQKTPKQKHGKDANMTSHGADVANMQRRLPRLDVRQAKKVRHSGKVSKAMQSPDAIEPLPDVAPVTRKSAPIKQELIAPHEWASLLNNIESEPDDTHVGGEVLGEVELASDDLWERLSSTRWIKPPREDFHNDTTVANRPKPAPKDLAR
jgi:hypothetical protein